MKLSKLAMDSLSRYLEMRDVIDDPESSLAELRKTRIELERFYKGNSSIKRTCIITFVLSIIFAWACLLSLPYLSQNFWTGFFWDSRIPTNNVVDYIFTFSFGLFPISFFTMVRTYFRKGYWSNLDIEETFKILESRIFDRENMDIPIMDKTIRYLSRFQTSTEKYNSIYMQQVKKLYYLGICVMSFGALIIIGTVFSKINDNSAGIIEVISGFVGGILTNFIGAIFIKMYMGTMETIVNFHKSTFENSGIYLANALASQINDDSLRNQTVSEIAKLIVTNKS